MSKLWIKFVALAMSAVISGGFWVPLAGMAGITERPGTTAVFGVGWVLTYWLFTRFLPKK